MDKIFAITRAKACFVVVVIVVVVIVVVVIVVVLLFVLLIFLLTCSKIKLLEHERRNMKQKTIR